MTELKMFTTLVTIGHLNLVKSFVDISSDILPIIDPIIGNNLIRSNKHELLDFLLEKRLLILDLTQKIDENNLVRYALRHRIGVYKILVKHSLVNYPLRNAAMWGDLELVKCLLMDPRTHGELNELIHFFEVMEESFSDLLVLLKDKAAEIKSV